MKDRLLSIAFSVFLTTCVVVALARADAASSVPPHLDLGLTLVDQIVATQQAGIFTETDGTLLNRYGGSWNSPTDPSYIRFLDATNGVRPANNTTCAPLVTHLLKAAYGWDWSQIPIYDPLLNQTITTASPKAYRYVSAIKTGAGFSQRLTNLFDVRAGDIAAYWDIGTDEGHAMIVVSVNLQSAKPYPADLSGALPALAGTTFYEVTVLDSSASGHSSDSRLITLNGVTALSGGVGTGIMGVLVNANGEVVAHTWSLPTANYLTKKNGVWVVNPYWLSGLNNRVQFQTTRELVFGRLAR